MIAGKKVMILTMAAMTFSLASCGTKEKPEMMEMETEAETETVIEATAGTEADTGTENAKTTEAAEPENTAPWNAEGNYIDDAGNHLLTYRTYVKFGSAKDGWGAVYMTDKEIFFGNMDETDGHLSGKLCIYNDDGSEGEGFEVTLTENDGKLILKKASGETLTFEPDDNERTDDDFLPIFSYNQVLADFGFRPLDAAAYDYLSFDHITAYDFSHALIPYVKIVDVDETDAEDVLLYGDYYLWEFKKEGDTLTAVSGGHCPGIIHLERFGEGDAATYSPKGSMDEAFTEWDARNIFGKYYDDYLKISSDEELFNSEYPQIIADYVNAFELDITRYQLTDDEPKELPPSRKILNSENQNLPAYTYPGPEKLNYVLYGYLAEHLGQKFLEEDVSIPCPVIINTDDSDKNDIKIYGDFWIFNYDRKDTVLECISGGSFPGCVHLKAVNDSYEVTGMDEVEDGAQYTKSAKNIFGTNYDDFLKIHDDLNKRDELRAKIIADYSSANDLSLTAFQDYGFDPVALPE